MNNKPSLKECIEWIVKYAQYTSANSMGGYNSECLECTYDWSGEHEPDCFVLKCINYTKSDGWLLLNDGKA